MIRRKGAPWCCVTCRRVESYVLMDVKTVGPDEYTSICRHCQRAWMVPIGAKFEQVDL